jgi:Zn-dependent protease with chaperone function
MKAGTPLEVGDGGSVNLEPQVVKSINDHRRAERFHRALAMLPLITVVAISGALLAGQLILRGLGYTLMNNDIPDSVVAYSLIAIPLALLLVMFYFVIRKYFKPVRRQFAGLTRRAEKYDRNGFARFEEALGAVCIGMGVGPPELAVLDLQTPNAAAFTERGKTRVGVTEELLKTDLSQGEREAVMAHEFAHITAGDALKAPSLVRGLNVALFLIAPAVVLLIGIVPVAVDRSSIPLGLGSLTPDGGRLPAVHLLHDERVRHCQQQEGEFPQRYPCRLRIG